MLKHRRPFIRPPLPYMVMLPVADPGFPRGGGANSPGGRQHTILPNFPKNCMKLKEFGPRGRPSRPPLRSSTGYLICSCVQKSYGILVNPLTLLQKIP